MAEEEGRPDGEKQQNEKAQDLLDKTVNRPEKQFARPGTEKRG